MGTAEGTVRDIAIISRVGKPVCCKVTELPREGEIQLSRVAAQREALTYFLSNLKPGDVIPAVVTNLTDFGAFCDIGCGVVALLGIENISVSRISHGRDRFREGQHIYGVVLRVDRESKRIFLKMCIRDRHIRPATVLCDNGHRTKAQSEQQHK